ncbi:MAG: response regulator [Elusimicrobiales bacterium]
MHAVSQSKKILIIEDDWNFQALLCVFLCEHGFEVESADNGRAGIKKVLCSRPDLILMDYNLGDMNGHDAAFWLDYMKGTRTIPVILLSAYAESSAVIKELSKYPSFRRAVCKSKPLEHLLGEILSVLCLPGRKDAN